VRPPYMEGRRGNYCLRLTAIPRRCLESVNVSQERNAIDSHTQSCKKSSKEGSKEKVPQKEVLFEISLLHLAVLFGLRGGQIYQYVN
jgi:hypothetical protein